MRSAGRVSEKPGGPGPTTARATLLGRDDRLPRFTRRCADHCVRLVPLLLLAWLASYPRAVHAQLLSYQRGESYSSTTGEWAPSYDVQYQQVLHKAWSASFDYLNEGHYTGHHPDGYGLELWYWLRLPTSYPLSLSVGAGTLYYFDTITPAGGASVDSHGFAPMASATLRGRLWHNWDWMLTAKAIDPSHDIKTQMLMLGVGYWIQDAPSEAGGQGLGILDRQADGAGPDELSAYGLLDVINISGNPSSWGASVEYRHRFQRYIDGTLTYLYEGDPKVARRSGFSGQIWPVRATSLFGTEIGAGFGAYAFIDRKHIPTASRETPAQLAPIVSLMLSYPTHSAWFTRFIWDRVVSNYSRDADIWRLGVGRSL